MKKLTSCIILLLAVNLVQAQNALDFDGTNDIVQTNCSGVSGNADRTFEAWVYVPTSAPASNLCILDYGSSATASRNTFMVNGSRGLSFIAGGTNTNIGSTANVVPSDVWTHVALVMESGTGYFYVNGIGVGSGNLTGVNTPQNGTGVRLGERVSGGSIPFQGKIDEVRMWNVARTQTQIQNNMNNELCNGSPNLLLYLPMNQGTAGGNNSSVTNVQDLSNNGVTGSLTGFALNGATSNWVSGATLGAGMVSSSTQQAACNSYTWSANNQTYTSSGTYSTVLTNGAGCDSIVSLQLTINSANNAITTQAACDTYLWSVNGQTYTASDTIVENLVASNGCPYTHTLRLTINNSYSQTDTIVNCATYTWSGNGQTYTASGVYTENLTTSKGCDSTLVLDLTIETIDNSVTDNGDSTLTANQPTGTYQWLYCDSSMAPIPGATAQTFQALENGNYAVEVTNGTCKDTSICMTVDYLSLEKMDEWLSVTMFPNPTEGPFELNLGKEMDGEVQIIDLHGKVLYRQDFMQKEKLSLAIELAPGMYTVLLGTIDGHQALLKLTKR